MSASCGRWLCARGSSFASSGAAPRSATSHTTPVMMATEARNRRTTRGVRRGAAPKLPAGPSMREASLRRTLGAPHPNIARGSWVARVPGEVVLRGASVDPDRHSYVRYAPGSAQRSARDDTDPRAIRSWGRWDARWRVRLSASPDLVGYPPRLQVVAPNRNLHAWFGINHHSLWYGADPAHIS